MAGAHLFCQYIWSKEKTDEHWNGTGRMKYSKIQAYAIIMVMIMTVMIIIIIAAFICVLKVVASGRSQCCWCHTLPWISGVSNEQLYLKPLHIQNRPRKKTECLTFFELLWYCNIFAVSKTFYYNMNRGRLCMLPGLLSKVRVHIWSYFVKVPHLGHTSFSTDRRDTGSPTVQYECKRV